MRSIHIIIPADRAKIVASILDNLKIQYEKIEGKHNILYIISTTEEVVEVIIDAIRKIGVGTLFGNYQVYNLEIAPKPSEIPEKIKAKRISREEMLYDISQQAELNRNYVLSSILAAVLATLGLLTDNIIITIASMIIAPFFGPILGTSLGVVLNIEDLRKESLKSEFIGLTLSIMTGFAISLVLPYSTLTSQILYLTNPTYISIIFAIVAGIAAAISVISVASMALVGVAIAASIVPPAVNIGIGLSFLIKNVEPAYSIIFGSLLILIINVLAINTMSIVFFWLIGIKPGESIRKELLAKKTVKRRLIVLIFIFLVSILPIIYTTAIHYEEKRVESLIRKDVLDYMSENYPRIEIIDLDVTFVSSLNKSYIYLTIGFVEINNTVFEIASNIQKFISSKYHVVTKVYLTIYIVSS